MFTLDDLARIIAARADAGAESSYTASLLAKGPQRCAKKFGEEAVELAIAAVGQDEAAVRAEAADVLYHLLVVLQSRGVCWSDPPSPSPSRRAIRRPHRRLSNA